MVSISRVDIVVERGAEESLGPEFYSYCSGVWIEDGADKTTIKCYPVEPGAFVAYVHLSMPFAQEVTVIEEEEKDYVSIVRSHFTPVRVGDVTILPPWRKTGKTGRVIIIEPGMAFGTGRHESTKLMLRMMKGLDLAGKDVLDVGTGSGVLALYACMEGAQVVAVDNDPLATEAARKGSRMNRCDLLVACAGAEAIRTTFDVVLANLDYDTFCRHGATVAGRVRKDGYLIASGIEQQFESRVPALFQGLTLVKKTRMRDWRGYVLQAH